MQMNRLPLLIKLSETEKRALIIIFIIVTFCFVLFGLIVKAIRNWMERKGRAVDSYMYDFVKYGIVKNSSEFRTYVTKRETRTLYLSSRWMFRILIAATVAFILIFNHFFEGNFQIFLDILGKLLPELHWPTTSLFGMEIICDWPEVVRPIEVYTTFEGYVTYVYALVCIYSLGKLIHDILLYNARISRANKAAITAFGKNLDNGVDQINE